MDTREHLNIAHTDIPWKIRSRIVHPATTNAEREAFHHALHCAPEETTPDHAHAWIAGEVL